MANADKCYLQIPFKQYLQQLKLDAKGQLTQQVLDRAAIQEFENYKAIERRINEPACRSGACQTFYAFSDQPEICPAMDALVAPSIVTSTGGVTSDGTAIYLPVGVWIITATMQFVDQTGLLGPSTGELGFEVTGSISTTQITHRSYNNVIAHSWADPWAINVAATALPDPPDGPSISFGGWNQTGEAIQYELIVFGVSACGVA